MFFSFIVIFFSFIVSQNPNLGTICAEIFSIVWRGLFESSTALFRYERERVLTNSIKTGFYNIQQVLFYKYP